MSNVMQRKSARIGAKARTLASLAIGLALSNTALAALIDRGGGLIYDTDLNITWLANANLAATNTFGVSMGSQPPGFMNWSDAKAWIKGMNEANYLGYNDWRLPIADPSCTSINCTSSEMGHLFYTELGGTPWMSIGSSHNNNYSLFSNIQTGGVYWTSTIRDGYVVSFMFGNGAQIDHEPVRGGFVWPVRDGDVAPVVPQASAGPDQAVNEGDSVTLDGSGSNSPSGNILTYDWQQVAGNPAVTLDLTDPVHPTFTAPNVQRSGSTLSFQLVVNDGTRDSEPDTVDITIKDVNHPPVADAGDDQTVQEGSPVALNGSASYDRDNDTLTFSWTQTGGQIVDLTDANMAQPIFIAPLVGPAGETLIFQLTVEDGIASAMDEVIVRVDNVNHAPIANAGDDQTVDEGSSVTLNGSASSDPDGNALIYAWTQLSGPVISLSDDTSQSPSFTAPAVGAGGADLEFELLVSDGELNSTDLVTVHILDKNDPPACELASVSPAMLWPPNHKLIQVVITNVSDPNSDQVTINIDGVTQDEPTIGLGEGGTSPDAVIQDQGVLLRAERAGNGNGRVYEINFTAEDSDGASCTGTVTVCVPYNRNTSQCVNDGQHHDSLQP